MEFFESARPFGATFPRYGGELFGDGADGDVTIAANTTLAVTKYYRNLTVGAFWLKPDGYPIFVSGTLRIAAGGSIICNGGAGTGGAGGGAGGVSCMPGSRPIYTSVAACAGGNGNVAAGSAGGVANPSHGGKGGNGGAGVGGLGGNSGICAAPGVSSTLFTKTGAFQPLLNRNWDGINMYGVLGGSGGGGGGGNGGAAKGGGGGAGGGIIIISARRIVIENTGLISCDGGAGGDGDPAGDTGGGGGGGGGYVVLHYEEISCANGAAVNVRAAAGAKGLKGGGGSDGNIGIVGNTFLIPLRTWA